MALVYNEDAKQSQIILNQLGFNCGVADGKWGNNSKRAYKQLLDSCIDPKKSMGVNKVCWGKKLTEMEVVKVAWVVKQLAMSPNAVQDMMACMAWETGEQFRPDTRSPVSSATGLIQFMDATAKGMGTTTLALSKMSVSEQLDWVLKYFLPYKGKLTSLSSLYMAILWPRGVGQDDDYVLWTRGTAPKQYLANAGLDIDKDGDITIAECMYKVNHKMMRGFLAQHCAVVK